MRELFEAAATGSTAGLVGLTFDDGYADFATEAVPVLLQYGFTATVFVVAGKMGARNDWDWGPEMPLMPPQEVRDVARLGMEVGSHGVDHRSLSEADADVITLELKSSREILESLLDRPVGGFCYPYGLLSDSAVTAVRATGYDYAVSTWQHARRDMFAFPRTYVGDRDGGPRLYGKRLRHRLRWWRS